MKINTLLRKIIYELSYDARQPASKIAKKVGTSKDVVFYNIKTLIKKGIVKRLVTLINTEYLGYQRYELFIQISDFSSEKEIIEYLVNHNMFLWVRSCLGDWDILSEFYSKNSIQAEEILKDLRNKYGQKIKQISLSQVTKEHSFPLKLIGYAKEELYSKDKQKEVELDKEDYIILRNLSNNARIHVTEISKTCSLSTDAIIYRIKNMIRKNVIIGYRAVIDEQKIGFIKFKLIIKLKSVDSQDYNKLFTYFLIQKNTQYVKTCFGQWDLSATILTKDILELKDIVSQIRTDLKESLEECKTLILYEEHKNNYFPEGIVRYIRIPTEKRKLTKQSTTPTKYQ